MSWRDFFFPSTANRRKVRRGTLGSSLRNRGRRVMNLELLEQRAMFTAGPTFSVPTFVMDAASDTGVTFQTPTFNDNITNVTQPTLNGTVQDYTLGDSITINVYADANGDGVLETGVDTLLGSVAVPDTTVNNAAWSFVTPPAADLNQIGLGTDGLRTLFATATDNSDATVSAAATTPLFIDTNGPQITAVTYHNSGQNVFSTLPSGPQSNVTQIDVEFTDAAIRPADPTNFYGTYAPAQSTAKNSAVNQVLAAIPSNYQLVGAHGGIVPISSATFTDTTGARPGPGKSLVTLTFAQPLPSDTYTLTVLDSIQNDAGNALDGEPQSAASGYLPSGNGFPGGSFSGSFALQGGASLAVQLTAGVQFGSLANLSTGTSMVAPFYKPSDAVFAGNFPASNGVADGFSKLAAYGLSGGQFRFLFQNELTGAVTSVVSPVQLPAMPVAGHFDTTAANGDEIALFTGSTWFLLSNDLQSVKQIVSWKSQSGLPVVGDFDGDGMTDIASWQTVNQVGVQSGMLTISYASSGFSQIFQQPISLSFPGARARPVAVNIDGDNIDDLGLWLPDSGVPSTTKPADWYFLPSGGIPLSQHTTYNPIHYAFGSSVGLPLTGTFAATTATGVFPAAALVANPLSVSVTAPLGVSVGAKKPTPKPIAPTPTPVNMSVQGTAANDSFQLIAGSSPNTWKLIVNGVARTITSTTRTLNLDGLAGTNALTITGTGKDESAELWPDHVVFKSGNLTLLASHVSNVTVVGSGTDKVRFHDAPGANAFVARAGFAQLTGKGYSLTAQGYATVQAFSMAGAATVADFYEATAQAIVSNVGTVTTMTDKNISVEAMYFSKVQIHSPNGAVIKTFLAPPPPTGVSPVKVLPAIRLGAPVTPTKPKSSLVAAAGLSVSSSSKSSVGSPAAVDAAMASLYKTA